MTDEGVSVIGERTMVYGRVGFATSQAKTAAEAIALAGLDYEIDLEPIFTQRDEKLREIPGHYAVQARETGKVFGTVRSRYNVFQNREVFSFADKLADEGGIFEAAFQRRDGAEVGLTMRFPEHIMIGGEDAVDKYLILRSRHDGSGSLIAGIQMVRMGCLNQFDAVLRASKNSVRIPHTRSLELQAAAASKVLQVSSKAAEQFARDAETLLQLPMTDEDVDTLITSVLEEIGTKEAQAEKLAEGIKANFLHTETLPDAMRHTGWGALNAIGEYYDHVVDYRSAGSNLRSMINGRSAHAKHAAQRLLLNG